MGLIDRIRGRSSRNRVWVGMFGKHPAWDDHIYTSDLESAALVELRTRVYTQGIGGRIDSGAWDRLGSAERLAGFAHTLVWAHDDGLVVARLVASVDGKGRERYPLVACALCQDLPGAWVLGRVLERVGEAAATSRGAKTREEVTAEIDRARAELRAESASVADAGGSADGEPAALMIEARGGRETLDRAMYCVRRDMRAYVRQDLVGEKRGSRIVDASPKHIRVGAYADSGGEACSLWLRVLGHVLGEGAEVMAIAPDGAGFVDLIVGRAEAEQFYCLQAGEVALPAVGDVPYEVDEQTRLWVSGLLDDLRSGRRRDADPGR